MSKKEPVSKYVLPWTENPATTTRIASIAKATVIHIGESTHHQDQVTYPVSFNPMRSIVSSPQKPIPPLLELLLLIVSISFH